VLHLAQLVAEGVDGARERLQARESDASAANNPVGSDGAAAT
jgi:hypothetical protein